MGKVIIGIILAIFLISFISAASSFGYNYLITSPSTYTSNFYTKAEVNDINDSMKNYVDSIVVGAYDDTWINGTIDDKIGIANTTLYEILMNGSFINYPWNATNTSYLLVSQWNSTNISYMTNITNISYMTNITNISYYLKSNPHGFYNNVSNFTGVRTNERGCIFKADTWTIDCDIDFNDYLKENDYTLQNQSLVNYIATVNTSMTNYVATVNTSMTNWISNTFNTTVNNEITRQNGSLVNYIGVANTTLYEILMNSSFFNPAAADTFIANYSQFLINNISINNYINNTFNTTVNNEIIRYVGIHNTSTTNYIATVNTSMTNWISNTFNTTVNNEIIRYVGIHNASIVNWISNTFNLTVNNEITRQNGSLVNYIAVVNTSNNNGDIAQDLIMNNSLVNGYTLKVGWLNTSRTNYTSSSATAFVTVADLNTTLVLLPNYNYTFNCKIMFTSNTTTTGIRLNMLTTTAPRLIAYQITMPIVADAAAGYWHGAGTASNDTVVSPTVEAVNTNYIANVDGIIQVAGVTMAVVPTFGSEVLRMVVNVTAGSHCQWKNIDGAAGFGK